MSTDLRAALEFAGALQRVLSLKELVEEAWRASRSHTRYPHAWLCLFEEGNTCARVVQAAGEHGDFVLANCPLIPVAGDPMVQAIVEGRMPVVVVDAATDPRTNKEIVARLGNRSIVNVPMVLGPTLLGAFGVGTFGDEPAFAPTDDELQFLTVLGVQLASAYSRLQLLEERRRDAAARDHLERHLESLQRVEIMGVLASGVAHDLANYLTIIQSNVGLLRPDGGEAAVLADVDFAVGKAREVVQQLLALGRAHGARREPLDLNERVASTLHLVRSALPRKVRVTHDAHAVPRVNGDPVQVDQVLANLLLNARDAIGPAGTIRVGVDEQLLGAAFVEPHPWARPGRYGHVSVADDGCGIPPEIMGRIFDPLFSTKSRGTGLGLAVVSRVVRQHEGIVRCASTPGAGTTFDVYLPAQAA
ncbi:MAG: GAF domain-containing protein [Deltaproteobacteria bacterium]|nr:GAF domain-containing protein [Deltaproteobacteria bacterium]